MDCSKAAASSGPAHSLLLWRAVVIAGLDPAIHRVKWFLMDARIKSAQDECEMKVIGIAGWSGAGKTTLLTRVIPRLTARGLRVSTIKHAHHGFDVDQPGKDSHTHRMAGATEVLVSSANRFALMHELRGAPELTLAALLGKLAPVEIGRAHV